MSAVIRLCGPRERVEGKKERRATTSVAGWVHTPEGRLHSRVCIGAAVCAGMVREQSQIFVSWSWHVRFPLAGERRGWPGEGRGGRVSAAERVGV